MKALFLPLYERERRTTLLLGKGDARIPDEPRKRPPLPAHCDHRLPKPAVRIFVDPKIPVVRKTNGLPERLHGTKSPLVGVSVEGPVPASKIGRASCRERV